MSKVYLSNNADGNLSIMHIPEDGWTADWWVTKVLFELSRTTDMLTHFDPTVHTREAIATGLEGHRALALIGECEDTDLPSDRYFRNAWEWEE